MRFKKPSRTAGREFSSKVPSALSNTSRSSSRRPWRYYLTRRDVPSWGRLRASGSLLTSPGTTSQPSGVHCSHALSMGMVLAIVSELTTLGGGGQPMVPFTPSPLSHKKGPPSLQVTNHELPVTGHLVDLTVVIPTYNQAELLRECLRSLASQSLSHDRYEIVVVDDGSTDHTAAVVREVGLPGKIVKLSANPGRSGARNEGVRPASGQLGTFVDSDIIVRQGFPTLHLGPYRSPGPRGLSPRPVV